MKRKPTPAQIAARERFAEMARSGAFKRRVKRNPATEKIWPATMKDVLKARAVYSNAMVERANVVSANRARLIRRQMAEPLPPLPPKPLFPFAYIGSDYEGLVLGGEDAVPEGARIVWSNPSKRKKKSLTRRSQATGRAPTSRLIMRRRKTLRAPKGFFANPASSRSPRHPLEGHPYHKKSDAELIFIARDAHQAAVALKGLDAKAENKYLDQMNDALTVRHFRKGFGGYMPDWYKKRYLRAPKGFFANPNPAARTYIVRARGNRFQVAHMMAVRGIPFAFVEEQRLKGSREVYTVGKVGKQHAIKLRNYMVSEPDADIVFYSPMPGLAKNPVRRRDSARTRNYSANPRLYRVLERRPSASSWSPVGAFPSRQRALQYARAYHRAASSPVAVRVTTG